MVRINETYHLSQESHGFSLVEKTIVTAKETGEKKIGEKKRYAGSLYQALQLFLHAQVDQAEGTLIDVLALVQKTIGEIEAAEKQIKKEFRVEVYISRGKNG
jgi:hypothetical protein